MRNLRGIILIDLRKWRCIASHSKESQGRSLTKCQKRKRRGDFILFEVQDEIWDLSLVHLNVIKHTIVKGQQGGGAYAWDNTSIVILPKELKAASFEKVRKGYKF